MHLREINERTTSFGGQRAETSFGIYDGTQDPENAC